MLHRRLGHPSNETLVRMLGHGGATDEMVKLATDLACPSCHLSKPPQKPFPSRPEVRSVVFNTVVHADLKYMHDFKEAVHQAKLLRNRRPDHVAAKAVGGPFPDKAGLCSGMSGQERGDQPPWRPPALISWSLDVRPATRSCWMMRSGAGKASGPL